MKKYLTIVSTIIVILLITNYLYFYKGIIYIPNNENKKVSWIEKEQFAIEDESGKVKKFKLKGVNLGLGIPGHFTTEKAIDKETYLRWFKMIKDLGANTIRIYTLSGEDFYEALYEYNSKNSNDPLYLIHGVWVDDNIHMSNVDAFDKKFEKNMLENAKDVVNAIHGRLKIGNSESGGKQEYTKDISKWVIGYIFGVEWEPDTVIYTNKIRQDIEQYEGKYIYTKNATPFEIFLAKVTDEIISYESKKYGVHRNFALSNWPTTDPIEYTELQRAINVKYASVDVEHIKTTDEFLSNQFASYHAYPYYPEFEYNGNDKVNLYKNYLTRLNEHHKMAVVISEFGVSTSRGMAAYEQNRSLGRDQGNMTEQEQGEAIKSMYKDIMESGSAGGMVFIWQDEWFKRTWNTMANIDLKNTAYWSDYQTNEQYFGLLSFDPGEKKSVSYPDGDKSEWTKSDKILESNDYGIYSKYDEKYVYFMIDFKSKKPNEEKIYIPIDITPKTGAKKIGEFNIKSDRGIDFVIEIDGKQNSKMFVQDRYDNIDTMHTESLDKFFNPYSNPPKKDSENFRVIRMVLNEKAYYKRDEKDNKKVEKINMEAYYNGLKTSQSSYYTISEILNTGELKYGNGNPSSKEFNNLSDYYFGKDFVEIRIPWELLNFYNPSKMQIHDDYYEHKGVNPIKIDKMYVGVGKQGEKIDLAPMELKAWGKKVKYHERLKKSYYILKEYWNREGA